MTAGVGKLRALMDLLRRHKWLRLGYAGAVFGTALLFGCGGGDDGDDNQSRFDGDEADVAAVVDDFAQAGKDGDGDRVCDEIFAPPLAANISKESGHSCAAEVQQNLPEGKYELEATEIDVTDEEATARVVDEQDNRSVLHFVKIDDAWRIVRVTAAG